MANRGSWSVLLVIICTILHPAESYVYYRNHRHSEDRNVITCPAVFQDQNKSCDADIVTIDRYLRNYMTGPIDDEYIFLNYDVIMTYVGPKPIGSGIYTGSTIRAWAMFDDDQQEACSLNAIHDFGQVALFTCPTPGIYRAYAHEEQLPLLIPSPQSSLSPQNPTLVWRTNIEKKQFDLIVGTKRTLAESINFVKSLVKSGVAVQSDPVVINKSYYCYYWMYRIVEKARVGYIMDEVIPSVGVNGSSYLLLNVLIWVAEPSSVHVDETDENLDTIVISDYSKMLTNRFSVIGLFPCLRRAHSVIEIVEEIAFVPASDQNNPLNSSPHWKAILKIHSDRLIGTLSDVSFTIASRQNIGSFKCFVGDTRVFINLRKFEFVQRGKLERTRINLEYSHFGDVKHKPLVKHQLRHVFGHGVHHVGFAWSKHFQPATVRSDMVIIGNPCIAQEFAFSVGGSLYVADGLLQKGTVQATKVYVPEVKDPGSRVTDPQSFRHYLRVFDVVFTPTHFIILLADGDVIVHSSSVSQKGLGKLTNLRKYIPGAFVKRRWCPKTATPKLSSMMVPVFSKDGSIVLLQVYPTEGSTRMWVEPPSSYCTPEGIGFTPKAKNQEALNETEIHYNEYVSVNRSDHQTGLLEKKFDPRPEPPKAAPVNFEEELTFLVNEGNRIASGYDPHFPPDLTNPASHSLSDDFTDYNQAVVYVLDHQKIRLKKVLEDNGINAKSSTSSGGSTDELGLYTVEFTAVEKQFIAAVKFKAAEIANEFSSKPKVEPFQMILTTMTVTNLPFKVKIRTDYRAIDEQLETIIPFPGVILIRPAAYSVDVVVSRDLDEEEEHKNTLRGSVTVEYTPKLFTMNTAIPSYVIDFGDIFVYTSLEGRFARPLHFYKWETINTRLSNSTEPLVHNDSSLIFRKKDRLYDAVMTEQGIISVLWRKSTRYIVQDDEVCLTTPDADIQTVAMGSVVSLEGLREVKPFFRNDNVFQASTPDGEIIYGVYDVKPHSPFDSCETGVTDENDACIEQPTESVNPNRTLIPVCASDTVAPCKDPAHIPVCGSQAKEPSESCIRPNKLVCDPSFSEPESYERPKPSNSTEASKCDKGVNTVTGCLPKYTPREELRSVNILGTSFLSYLLGSLKSLSSLHPESPPPKPGDLKEPDICPFSSFKVYNTDFDFAEVGFQTRITGEISYLGSEIPTEAELIVEYERSMGIVIEIASSVSVGRLLTVIMKTIDIRFEMTDFTLEQLTLTSDTRDVNTSGITSDDLRARENTTVFSITLRPSIVNMRCKNADYFKTVQFNVGCNAFSVVRLLSEAAPLKRINWTEAQTNSDEYKWYRDVSGGDWNLTITRLHIFRKQLKDPDNIFKCSEKDSHCRVPYFELFQDDIFSISYRDPFFPQFEQFLTVSSRRVSGNVIIYDLLGSHDFNLTVNKLAAGCYSNGGLWYNKLLGTTKYIGTSSWAHENVYKHYKDCFEVEDETNREQPYELNESPFYLHNSTNDNKIRFRRNRNQIFIFRAVVVNTKQNRFTYCRLLDTFFMIRVTGIPIPRQGLVLWHYVCVILLVTLGFLLSYAVFYKFYTWKLDLGIISENY